jgi:hypothetical protein
MSVGMMTGNRVLNEVGNGVGNEVGFRVGMSVGNRVKMERAERPRLTLSAIDLSYARQVTDPHQAPKITPRTS